MLNEMNKFRAYLFKPKNHSFHWDTCFDIESMTETNLDIHLNYIQ